MSINVENSNGKHFILQSFYALPFSRQKINVTADSAVAVFLVCEGEASARINGGKKIALKKRDGLVLSSSASGVITVDGNARIICLQTLLLDSEKKPFAPSRELSLGSGDQTTECIYEEHINAAYVVAKCGGLFDALNSFSYLRLPFSQTACGNAERMVQLASGDGLSYNHHFTVELMIVELLIELNQTANASETGVENVERIRRFIIENYKDDIGIAEIAEAAGMNPSYMQRLYREKTGNSVGDFLAEYRVSQSISLMKYTDLPLIDIAVEVGFQNRQTFYNVFKKVSGYTPSTFRRFLSKANTFVDE